jgi:hypothetical protein
MRSRSSTSSPAHGSSPAPALRSCSTRSGGTGDHRELVERQFDVGAW